MPQRLIEIDGVVHEFPADATDLEISAALKAPPKTGRGPKARTWTDVAVDALPAVGGGIGGIVGGIGGTAFGLGIGGVPGAIGGAGLGGATGEAAKQLINRYRGKAGTPTSVAEAARDMALQGGIQAAGEATGQGLMKAGGMAAHGLMDFAIRPAPTVAEEFGDIAGTAIRERLPVGSIVPGGTKGSALANAARGESGAKTTALLKESGKAGTMLSPEAIARGPVSKLAGDIAKQPLSDSELHQVSKLFTEYLRENPSEITPLAVKEMKTAAQRIAKPIFKALNSGNIPPAGEAMKAQFNKAIADGAKDALETLPDVGAAVGKSEARTQGLIGTAKAIRRAESRRLPLVAEIAGPLVGAVAGGATGNDTKGIAAGAGTGVTAAVLTRAILSPRTTSRAALGLTNPAIQQALRQMPRASVYALLERLTRTHSGSADTP